jgi:peptide/nickel transport system permease protein
VTRFLVRRLTQAIIVVAGVVIVTFAVGRLVPGDPAVTYAGPRASRAQLEATRRALGLDRSWPAQLFEYVKGVLTGDWGTALHTHRPVLDDLATAVPASLELVLAALVIGVLVGLPLGIASARSRGRLLDVAIRLLSMVSVSMPIFWLGLILQHVFFQRLGWLPVAGEFDVRLDFSSPLDVRTHFTILDALISGNWPVFRSSLSHVVLPALTVAAYPAGAIAQMTRASLLETVVEDHVRMARALGFGERAIFGRLALRPALNPVIALVALVFAYSLANTFLVESIYNWPGLGSYAVAAIQTLDTPAILGVTLFVALAYVVANLLVDIVQSLVDPRVRGVRS